MKKNHNLYLYCFYIEKRLIFHFPRRSDFYKYRIIWYMSWGLKQSWTKNALTVLEVRLLENKFSVTKSSVTFLALVLGCFSWTHPGSFITDLKQSGSCAFYQLVSAQISNLDFQGAGFWQHQPWVERGWMELLVIYLLISFPVQSLLSLLSLDAIPCYLIHSLPQKTIHSDLDFQVSKCMKHL